MSYTSCSNNTTKKERKEELQEQWKSKFPCKDCKITDLCKYAYGIARTDFNPDIFKVTIECMFKK